MAINITYGEGGFCENCDNTHDHLLHNIVEQFEVPDPEPTPVEQARTTAIAKLTALGLTNDEITALIG